MKGILNWFYNRFNIVSDRTKNISKHIGLSSIYQAVSIAVNFLIVPISLDYLDQANYGIWLVLSSFVSWFSLFDIGLDNGLRNKFAESKAIGDTTRAKTYVSTAFFSILFISFSLIVLFLISSFFIDWTVFFNTKENMLGQLRVLVPFVFSFFCVRLFLKLVITIYLADQKHSYQNMFNFISQLLVLILLWLVSITSENSLVLYGFVFSFTPIFILLILNHIAFTGTYRSYRPSLKFFNKKHLKEIVGLGFNFFVIQIAVLVLFSSDNFIITNLFAPEEVVPYNISYKYFSIVIVVYTVLISPFWSSFTEAYAKGDIDWIKRSVKNIQKLWIIVPLLLVVMLFLSKWFYRFWLGNTLTIPFSLSLVMALFVILNTFNMVYINFINGISKIKLQLITALFSIVINIPLSYLFAKTFNMGVNGVMLATCFCLTYSVILRVIQYNKIINNKAKGIWNK